MNERDQLRAELLDDHGYCVNCGEDAEDCECAFEGFIDAILAAGYRAETERGPAMNDHAAMTAINATLDQYFKGEISEPNAINQIARISNANQSDHEAAK